MNHETSFEVKGTKKMIIEVMSKEILQVKIIEISLEEMSIKGPTFGD